MQKRDGGGAKKAPPQQQGDEIDQLFASWSNDDGKPLAPKPIGLSSPAKGQKLAPPVWVPAKLSAALSKPAEVAQAPTPAARQEKPIATPRQVPAVAAPAPVPAPPPEPPPTAVAPIPEPPLVHHAVEVFPFVAPAQLDAENDWEEEELLRPPGRFGIGTVVVVGILCAVLAGVVGAHVARSDAEEVVTAPTPVPPPPVAEKVARVEIAPPVAKAPVAVAPEASPEVVPAEPEIPAPVEDGETEEEEPSGEAAGGTADPGDLLEGFADQLTTEDIVAGVTENRRNLAPCLNAAADDGEIARDRPYTLVLDWTVNADGSVSKPRVTGPAELLDSTLASCVTKQMLAWRFKSSPGAMPITNYPFGPVTVRAAP